MSKIQDVVSELRILYPDYEILVWQKDTSARLIVNERVVFKFEPDFMEKHLEKFGEDALKETIKMWAEYIQIRYIKRLKRFKKESGRPALGFSESQMKFAIQNTKSNSAAARFLNISYNTYKKYAVIHNLFDVNKNQAGKGILKGGKRVKVPWKDIFANKNPNYELSNLKRRLVEELVIEEKCETCGYSTHRSFDNKIALVLDFKDGNTKNMARENMRFLCYNCKFNTGTRLGLVVKKQMEEIYDSHKIEEEKEKSDKIWKDMNPETEESVIIQTNVNDTDIWKKFNQ
jgi:hypothetical protein